MSETSLAQINPVGSRQGLIELMIDKGATAEQMALLLETQLRWEANEARKAFISALEQFKRNPPEILKTKAVSYLNKDGSTTNYKHAELDKANELIATALLKVGITHTWRTSEAGGRIVVTCVLRHSLGHAEDGATLSGPGDNSGGKNGIQAIGSTQTYLERYTLLASVGLAPKGEDDDGQASGSRYGELGERLEWIAQCKDYAELEKVFKAAYKEARQMKDLSSCQALASAKDKRKLELREAA